MTSRESIERILEHLGLPTRVPAFHAARPPPQAEKPFDVLPELEADPPASDDIGD